MVLEQRDYLEQHKVALTSGMNVTDSKKLEQLMMAPDHSVVSGMKNLIMTFDSFTIKHEKSNLLQFMPFFIGRIEDYTAALKIKVLGRLVQEFTDKAMNFLRDNIRTRLWVLEQDLDQELYRVLTDLLLSDLVNKVAVQAQAMLIEQEKFEAMEKLGEESGKAPLRRGVFIIHDLVPNEYVHLFEMTVFLAALFEAKKKDLVAMIEKHGFRSTMELAVIYGMQTYNMLLTAGGDLQHRFATFTRLFASHVTLGPNLRSEMPIELIWAKRKQKDRVEAMIFFFCRSSHTDILGFINTILARTQKAKSPAIVERVKKFCREADFDGLSRELATYINLAH